MYICIRHPGRVGNTAAACSSDKRHCAYVQVDEATTSYDEIYFSLSRRFDPFRHDVLVTANAVDTKSDVYGTRFEIRWVSPTEVHFLCFQCGLMNHLNAEQEWDGVRVVIERPDAL